MPKQKYIPGVCNIGLAEREQRKATGIIMAAITMAIYAIFVATHADGFDRGTAVFLPAMFAATGFLQYYMHFCAGFGMQGLFNFSATVSKTESTDQAVYRRKDRRKALQILLLSAVIGLVISALASAIPHARI